MINLGRIEAQLKGQLGAVKQVKKKIRRMGLARSFSPSCCCCQRISTCCEGVCANGTQCRRLFVKEVAYRNVPSSRFGAWYV